MKKAGRFNVKNQPGRVPHQARKGRPRSSWIRIAVAAVFLVAAVPSPARMEGGGEAEALKAFKDDPEAAGKAAVSRSTSDTLARTAFAHFVMGTHSLRTADSMKVILGFAAREGMFTSASCHLGLCGQRDTVVQALAGDGRPEAKRLAAGALLFAALADHLDEAREAAFEAWKKAAAEAQSDGEGDTGVSGGAKKRGGKGKGKAAGAAGKGARAAHEARPDNGPVVVPAALLQGAAPATVSMAIRAAAYAKDGSVSDAVAGCTTNEPHVAGARLLYAARMGLPLPDDALAAAFAPPPRAPAALPPPGARGPRGPADNVPDALDVPGLCPAIEALGLAGDPQHLPRILQAATHEDPRVRLEAARALRRFESDEAQAFMGRWLQACDGPVAVELADAIGARPDKRMVPALIERLRKEQGRLRMDLVHALSSIAGEQKAQTAEAWAGWWTTNGPSFEVDAAASAAYRARIPVQRVDLVALGFFYSLPIQSDRICYVVDSSMSMKGDRIASLRRNLAESIDGLAKHVRYDIVDFGGEVVVLEADGLLEDRRKGVKRAEDMPLSLGTRAYDAMERAARIPAVDTLLFLSDGAPVRGQFNAWADILRVLSVMHRYAPIAIHSVNFDPHPANAAAMRKLAACRAGRNADVDAGEAADEW